MILEASEHMLPLKRLGVVLVGPKIGPDAVVHERRVDPEQGEREITFADMCAGLKDTNLSKNQLKQLLFRWVKLKTAAEPALDDAQASRPHRLFASRPFEINLLKPS